MKTGAFWRILINKCFNGLYYSIVTSFTMNRKQTALIALGLIGLTACNHSKPKPVSNNITKTTVTVNGKKDSVINNPQKNYGNATVSEPCVKCLIEIIQSKSGYKKLTAGTTQKKIVYHVNWITSSTPKDLGDGHQIINGMAIDVNKKTANASEKLITYLYDNKDAQFYLLNDQKKYIADEKISDISLKKIRNSCFWGVASAK
jgi:hypothetical protein